MDGRTSCWLLPTVRYGTLLDTVLDSTRAVATVGLSQHLKKKLATSFLVFWYCTLYVPGMKQTRFVGLGVGLVRAYRTYVHSRMIQRRTVLPFHGKSVLDSNMMMVEAYG